MLWTGLGREPRSKEIFLFAPRAATVDPDARFAVVWIGAMQTRTRGASVILSRVEKPYERSTLFEWLLTHHDEMVAAAGGRRIEWIVFAPTFVTRGLPVATGGADQCRTARMTWWRVRKEHARIEALRAAERADRERRAAASPRRDMPSQFRKGDRAAPREHGGSGEAETSGDDG